MDGNLAMANKFTHMTEEENNYHAEQALIKENNILIALFMGCRIVEDHGRNYIEGDFILQKTGFRYLRDNKLQFHSSWDWLMDAVEKIETIEPNKRTFIMRNYNCSVISLYSGESMDGYGENRKDAVFTSVSDFIKLHNKSNKK